MLSIRLSGDYLEVKTETFLGGNEFKAMMNLFETFKGAYYVQEKYAWIIPKEKVDDIVRFIGEDKIAWHHSIEDIKGIKTSVVPKFNVSHEALEDMHLSPYPFQGVGISFLHDIKQGLLADEMGLGS